MSKWFLQRVHYGDCNSCLLLEQRAFSQETNLHSNFILSLSCRMWNEISGTLILSSHVCSFKKIYVADFAHSLMIIRTFRIHYRFVGFRAKYSFTQSFVNMIGSKELTISDTKSNLNNSSFLYYFKIFFLLRKIRVIFSFFLFSTFYGCCGC